MKISAPKNRVSLKWAPLIFEKIRYVFPDIFTLIRATQHRNSSAKNEDVSCFKKGPGSRAINIELTLKDSVTWEKFLPSFMRTDGKNCSNNEFALRYYIKAFQPEFSVDESKIAKVSFFTLDSIFPFFTVKRIMQ